MAEEARVGRRGRLARVLAGHDIEETRRLHYVSDLGQAVEDGEHFSLAIRR